MSEVQDESDDLLRRAAANDPAATELLLTRYRPRLQAMITVRLEPRIARRLDASDIVQDTLMEAVELLPSYLTEPPMSFYPWLRRLAWQRLVKVFKAHVMAERRSVNRELNFEGAATDESAILLAEKLAAHQTSPSGQLAREELKRQVRHGLALLQPQDREILLLRYIEQLSVREIAEVTGVSEAAVKMRHMRALHRLRPLLGPQDITGG